MSRNAVLNAFSPAQEVTDPELFAGRREQVKELSDALRAQGSCPVIYGDRGLGKTSLAVQCQIIALGQGELLDFIGASDRALDPGETFLTFFITCADDVRNFSDLQRAILNSFRDFDLLDDSLDSSRKQLVDRQTRRKLSLKLVEVEDTRTYTEKSRALREEDMSLREQIYREANLLRECYEQRVLVIIDEIDRVGNTEGLAPFIKAMSGDQLKFVLVGIAQSLAQLNLDHPSVERQLWPVPVERMTRRELFEVADRALARLNASQRTSYRFSTSARNALANVAGGFPWFVHVIGQSALLKALDCDTEVVTLEMLKAATLDLINNRFAQHFKDSYQNAVRDSENREVVLRAFAAWDEQDIPIGDIYRTCRRLGVINPSVYKGHLSSELYGQPLMAPPFQERRPVRFRNEMFKRYITLRPSLYRGVDQKVHDAAKEWSSSS